MKKILITNEKTKQQYALIISDYEEEMCDTLSITIGEYIVHCLDVSIDDGELQENIEHSYCEVKELPKGIKILFSE